MSEGTIWWRNQWQQLSSVDKQSCRFPSHRSAAHHTYVNTSQLNSQIERTISTSQSNNSNVGAPSSSSSPHSISSAPPTVGLSGILTSSASGPGLEPQGDVSNSNIDFNAFKIKSAFASRDQSPHGTKHRDSRLQKAASFESRPNYYATVNIEPQRLYNYGLSSYSHLTTTGGSHHSSPIGRVTKSSSGHVVYSSVPGGVAGVTPFRSSRSDHQMVLSEGYAPGSPRDSSPLSVRSTSSSQSIQSVTQAHRVNPPLISSRLYSCYFQSDTCFPQCQAPGEHSSVESKFPTNFSRSPISLWIKLFSALEKLIGQNFFHGGGCYSK